VRALHQKWLCDKASALGAAILAGSDFGVAESGERVRFECATRAVSANVTKEHVGLFADSTLALLGNVPDTYCDPDRDLLPNAMPLFDVLSVARSERALRNAKAKRVPDILIAHAVYLLKQPHLSIRDFVKWLKRCKAPETRDIGILLKSLDGNPQSCAVINGLLALSRDFSEQTRNRIDAVDRLYDALVHFAGPDLNMLWWLRICLSLRSSLYCWPLMVAGFREHGFHGISLPIGLFLSPDGKSKVYFRIVDSTAGSGHRRYVPGKGDVWPHMEGSNLQWNREWADAFLVGLQAAKTLWSTQNGRLRFVDEAAAGVMLNTSLVVDMGAACDIVDSVFSSLDGTAYPLKGRSAEAYWVQAVLGMMLPGRQIPQGVVTGRVQVSDGVDEICHVEGIQKKLEYANNAGFSRVVLPSTNLEELDTDSNDASEAKTDHRDDDGQMIASVGRTTTPDPVATDNVEANAESSCKREQAPTDQSIDHEVRAFRQSLLDSRTRKTVEINFCRTVRNVADAMQVSGWRRTAFVRLPETQRAFSIHLRRLFLQEKVEHGARLGVKDRRDYDRNPWTSRETRILHKLDDYLLSDTRAIKFVDREQFDEVFPNGAEAEIGRWLAWKDHQVRSGNDERLRGPGLGILCLRSTETDNEMRLWSTIADTLSANPEWWNQFQWSGIDQAAQLLARLLGNFQANPSICSTPAPDLVVLFDEGNLTQRRTNPIFPEDFRGQWLDLLNASKDDPNARHPLNEALVNEGGGSLGTRIIVVYGPVRLQSAELPDGLDANDKEALERLAVFRFDFSMQAAYAMMNYGRPQHLRLAWPEVDERLRTLIAKRVLFSTRGRFYVDPQLLPKLREGQYHSNPHAQLHAAKALAPILEPRDLFIASNRDRTLEPEPVLEATWHLQRARMLVAPRIRETRIQCDAALSTLTFLRPFADWDTVKQLQRSSATLADAVALGRELLDKEKLITGRPPHSSRVAALLNAIGDFGRGLNGAGAESMRTQLSNEATELCTNALKTFEAASANDWHRQRCKLFSDYVYCMKILDIPDVDPRLVGALRYLEGTIGEVVRPDFYEHSNLDDYPLSRDWLKARWDDAGLALRDRSTHAYVAARLHIDRWKDGELVREPWDQPWIEYFALTTTKDFDPRQLHSPLTTWQSVYGDTNESTETFGRRVRDFVSYLPKKTEEMSWWGRKIRAATDNLWEFITHSNSDKRLAAYEADIALRFIRTVAMHETLPAFDFIERRDREWLARWPQRVGCNWSSEWNEMAAQVVAGQAGWASMLSSSSICDERAIELVQSWLHAFRFIGAGTVYARDPDSLLDLRSGAMPLVDTYRRKRANAVWNGYQLLAKQDSRDWAIFGQLRTQFVNILRELDGDSNSWFFAIASRKPHPSAVAGACMMLEHRVSEASTREVANKPGLEHFRDQLLGNIPDWTKYASENGCVVFEKLRQQFSNELC
jgi:hypothetical protein